MGIDFTGYSWHGFFIKGGKKEYSLIRILNEMSMWSLVNVPYLMHINMSAFIGLTAVDINAYMTMQV